MAPPAPDGPVSNGARLLASLPAVNLVTLVAAVALLWWRVGVLEQQVTGLSAAVAALQVEVAQLNGGP